MRAWECSEVPSAATTGALLLRERNRDSAPLVGRNRPRTTEMSACTLPAPPLPIATAPNSLNVGAQCSHAARPMRFQGSQPREVLRSHPPKSPPQEEDSRRSTPFSLRWYSFGNTRLSHRCRVSRDPRHEPPGARDRNQFVSVANDAHDPPIFRTRQRGRTCLNRLLGSSI